ncbi:tetratricopeptide repeat protein [Thiolapillus brandeum]|uniref:tetratricopeptide repeat protein n=1 Tax=Thiolapillus brandeum TaxID=1076588 RepID=UPI00155A05F5|nr:tetratricopeptide repeat protein [Thiolapillus brandeum]
MKPLSIIIRPWAYVVLMGIGASGTAIAADVDEGSAASALPMHVDPLDEGRASALHRGPNPHATLSAEQHIQVAAQHMAAGRLPQAMAVLSQALAKYPHHAELFNMRAALELKQQDIKGALADMEQAVKLEPDNALYRVTRSRLYLRFERKDEALADLNEAVKLAPKLVPAHFNRGSLLANLGREKEALADFDRCIGIAPELPAPWFNRGSMHWALGEKAKARADINHFIDLAKEPSWKQAGKDLLKVWDQEEAKQQAGPGGNPS